MRPSPTREALLEAACTLFYRDGIRATSVETILERAGVARQSLYQHFSSKDGLAAAFLNLRDERWRGWMNSFAERAGDDPVERLLAIYDFLEDWFAKPDFQGCAFINTAAEYSDRNHPFRILSAKHKALVLADIERLCVAAALADSRAMARKLALLMEGAIVTEQVSPGSGAAADARAMATTLISLAPTPTPIKKRSRS